MEHKCENCGQPCGTSDEWTEEERNNEMERNFGDLPEDDKMVVCDDCYNALMANFN